jgi:ABC-type branched-subunit amino acid transport system ATPase component/predicted MFS family arabinose efflux permease
LNEVDRTATASDLAAAVLNEEAARQATGPAAESLIADELLPGVGAEPLTLREGLAKGGPFTFYVLLMITALDELEAGALALLAPDIRDSFGVSDGTITFIASASAAFFVLGAFPMGYLADRLKRAPIIAVSTAFFSFFVLLSGLAVNAFMLFWTRFGAGFAKASTIPVHSSLIADTYPIGVRGRVGAVIQMSARSVAAVAPVIVGTITVVAGGDEGWRWAFLLLGLPVLAFVGLAWRIPEPPRGQWEQEDVLHDVVTDEDPAPVSAEAAFARLWQIRTLKAVVVAFSALGFVLFTLSVQANIFMEDEYGLGTLGRGIVTSIGGVAAAALLPIAGRRFDAVYRTDPQRALRLIGLLLAPLVFTVPAQFLMPNEYLYVAFDIPRVALSAAAFGMVGPVVQAIVPYRLRGLGTALITTYIFLIGGVGGGLMAALLIDAYGARAAIITLAIPSLLVGSISLLRGAGTVRGDLSRIVSELEEEQAERERRRLAPRSVPALQVSEIDFSYGPVQVLFDVSLEVKRGETLALLGTNGAGKSTILDVISGLATPSRGVVRLHGHTITYATPERRAEMGIHLLPGDRGVFTGLSIRDNLVVGAYRYRHDPGDVRSRIDRVVEMFPELGQRLDDRAGDLSGGQQQMLALARVLLQDPDVLAIDELSLGLAPTVVQDLLETVNLMKSAGQTMIIVEQSLTVALAVADRAIFLERGRVRFDGPARDLAERDDLVRAVFLGTEGD